MRFVIFLPAPHGLWGRSWNALYYYNGSYVDVQAARNSSGDGLSSGSDTATITVNAVGDTPSVTDATTDEDQESSSGLVITCNGADSTEITHFKITNIANGTLTTDGGSSITGGSFITAADGNLGLKFTPTPDSFADGSFDVQASRSSSGDGFGVPPMNKSS